MYPLTENVTMLANVFNLLNKALCKVYNFDILRMEQLDKFSHCFLDFYVKRITSKYNLLFQVFLVLKPFVKPLPTSEPE